MRLLTCLMLIPHLATAAELTPADVANKQGSGADRKGNTADDIWQFWFELAGRKGQFHRLDTYSGSVPKAGIKRKITGPIASWLPNKDTTVGWIYHRDWDGRFEGVWADIKGKQIIASPYAEKGRHCAVAITYTIPADGDYDISGKLTDLQVAPQFKQHDGVEWLLQLAEGGKQGRLIARGGPLGDGGKRPDSQTFSAKKVAAKKGQLIRLVIHPRKWWGSDLTKVEKLRIERRP